FAINSAVYDRSGTGVTGMPRWCNRLCPQIKANPDSLAAICAPANQHFMAQAQKTRKSVIGECDAGLTKINVPIFVENEFMGTAGGCGRLPEGGTVETFLIAKTLGLSEAQVSGLCHGLGTITQKQTQEMKNFIETWVADRVDGRLKQSADSRQTSKMKTMKVAVTVWEDRISPVFDASRRLLIAEIENDRVTDRSYVFFDPGRPGSLVKTLTMLDVPVLICGAVSQAPATSIVDSGITLIPFIAGEVDRVLEVYAKGNPLAPAFEMPGCHSGTSKGGTPSP
ncbi:PocR ligand-binding domain-containing protein, partial [Desulfosarcina sp.]|uniref:PocR ligand-binding domain-containing protein n=1 Tax=Desulfosarcina sp. TaxID=2027861 RepID=UPI003567DC06